MTKLVVTDREGQTVGVDAHDGISVMENIRDLDNSVDAICGGLCSCATCHVFVDPAWIAKLPPRSDEEAELLGDLSSFNQSQSRLSCQLTVSDALDGLVLTVAPEEF
jgi:2Fe-2S ferredoxin